MSRNQKIIFIILGTLLSSCCMLSIAAYVVLPRALREAFSDDPDKARQVAAQIADYTLPPGYGESVGMDMFVYKLVAITRADRRGLTIMLMQFNSSGVTREEMEQQMHTQSQLQGNLGGPMKVVGTETVTIKGQPVTLTISEGEPGSTNSVRIRQTQGVFQGKGGLVMLMVTGATNAWDKALLDNFYKSIR